MSSSADCNLRLHRAVCEETLARTDNARFAARAILAVSTCVAALVDYPVRTSRSLRPATVLSQPYYKPLAKALDVDVFAVNVYRGNDLTTLWDELRAANLTKPCASSFEFPKPFLPQFCCCRLLIAELGAQPVQAMNGQLSSDWPRSQWHDVAKHLDMAIGACYFMSAQRCIAFPF